MQSAQRSGSHAVSAARVSALPHDGFEKARLHGCGHTRIRGGSTAVAIRKPARQCIMTYDVWQWLTGCLVRCTALECAICGNAAAALQFSRYACIRCTVGIQ